MLRWIAALCLGALSLVLAPAAGLAAEKTFRAGAFAADITPRDFPIAIAGSMSQTFATSVTDHLHARCLVLDDGSTKLAIVIVDSCMVPREIFDEAKKIASQATGIPVEHMLMAATHTHSAPCTSGVFQNEPDANYQRFLTEQIAKGVIVAHEQLEPAQIAWGTVDLPDEVFNRRWKLKPGMLVEDPFGRVRDSVRMNPGFGNPDIVEPAGPVDPQIVFLSVRARDGRPISLFADYSLHYVGGARPVSSDYFGAFADRIAELLNAQSVQPPFVGILANGTSGDVNNNNYKQPRPPAAPGERIRAVADNVAQTVYRASQNLSYRDHVSLAMAERRIDLGVRLPSKEDLEEARKTLAEAGSFPYKDRKAIYARETVLLSEYPATVNVRLQAIRIGEMGIVSSPCETFVEIGLAIKAASPLKPTCTVELANGYNGYLPTPKHHEWGGYETWRARSSYLEVQASEKIQATLLELLQEVAR